MKTVKAYLVDPERCTVREIELPIEDKAARDEMRRLIGCEGMDFQMISDERDSVWVDEFGLTRGPCWAWKLHGMQAPFAGRGIIVGADEFGFAAPPTVPRQWVERDAVWLGEIVPEVHWLEESDGARTVVTYSRRRP